MFFTKRLSENEIDPRTILVVDDDASVRLLMTYILQQAGFQTIPACDGIDAMRRIDAGASFDMLLTDLSMPGMNGLELARRVRKNNPELPILFVSGSVESFPDCVHGAECLSKPFTADELMEAIQRTIGIPALAA